MDAKANFNFFRFREGPEGLKNTCQPPVLVILSCHVTCDCRKSLPAPTHTSRPCYHHIPTGRHPIISILMLHMPKAPNHLNLPCLTTSATLSTPKDCTNPHCASYPSAAPLTSISPSSVPSSPDFADLQPSSPRFQSHMSTHSGHKTCISFPLCRMMHPELSGYEITT